jgi:Tol biopolymer transport system component
MLNRCAFAVVLLIATVSFAAVPPVIETFSPWSNMTNLGPIVNSTAQESCVFVTKTGLSLYFASTRGGGLGNLDIYVSQRAKITDPWGPPKSVGPVINSAGNDHLPFITPDGHMMIFASDRAGSLNDLYISYRRNALDDFAWEAPVALSELNTTADDYAPWGFEDSTTGALVLFFSSNRTGGVGGYDIYTSTLQSDGKFSPPAVVPELSSADNDAMPTISQNGLELFLTSNRPGGLGSVDIWTSTRSTTSDHWSAPVNVPELNTTLGEQRAGVFGDGTHVIFFSGRTGGLGSTDLYEATRTRTVIVPVVGSTPGVNGQAFKTTGRIANAGATEISGKILFHPAATTPSTSDPVIKYRLVPHETRAFADLMATFGVSGIGSLEIVPDAGAAPASSFSIEDGDNSVVVPALETEDILVAGSRGVLTAPSDPGRFRMNIGFRTLGNGVTLTADLYDTAGSLIRSNTRSLPANYSTQMAASELVQGSVGASQSIVLTIQTGSVIAYASSPANGGKGSTLELVRRIEQ